MLKLKVTRMTILLIIVIVAVAIIALLYSDVFRFSKITDYFTSNYKSLDSIKKAELLFSFLANLTGTLVGAGLAFFFALLIFQIQSRSEDKQKRVETTFDLLQTYATPEMAESRQLADKVFIAHKDKTSIDAFYRDLLEDEKRAVRRVLFFFRRLQSHIEYDRLETHIALDLFGKEFIWWHYVWFETLVVPAESWDTSKQVTKLQQWVKDEAESGIYEQWVNEAKKSRAKRVPQQATGSSEK